MEAEISDVSKSASRKVQSRGGGEREAVGGESKAEKKTSSEERRVSAAFVDVAVAFRGRAMITHLSYRGETVFARDCVHVSPERRGWRGVSAFFSAPIVSRKTEEEKRKEKTHSCASLFVIFFSRRIHGFFSLGFCFFFPPIFSLHHEMFCSA